MMHLCVYVCVCVCEEIWWSGAVDWSSVSQEIVFNWQLNSSLLKPLTVSVHACRLQLAECRLCGKLASVSTSVRMRFSTISLYLTTWSVQFVIWVLLNNNNDKTNSFNSPVKIGCYIRLIFCLRLRFVVRSSLDMSWGHGWQFPVVLAWPARCSIRMCVVIN